VTRSPGQPIRSREGSEPPRLASCTCGRVPEGVEHERLFFIVTIGALLVVLLIFGLIVLVLGDNDYEGGNINHQPAPQSAPHVSLVTSTETVMSVVGGPE
jgi:hypothetical protein